jgi:hypothetical protein
MSADNQCTAITKANTQCLNRSLLDSELCGTHLNIVEKKLDLIQDLEDIIGEYTDVETYSNLNKIYPKTYTKNQLKLNLVKDISLSLLEHLRLSNITTIEYIENGDIDKYIQQFNDTEETKIPEFIKAKQINPEIIMSLFFTQYISNLDDAFLIYTTLRSIISEVINDLIYYSNEMDLLNLLNDLSLKDLINFFKNYKFNTYLNRIENKEFKNTDQILEYLSDPKNIRELSNLKNIIYETWKYIVLNDPDVYATDSYDEKLKSKIKQRIKIMAEEIK